MLLKKIRQRVLQAHGLQPMLKSTPKTTEGYFFSTYQFGAAEQKAFANKLSFTIRRTMPKQVSDGPALNFNNAAGKMHSAIAILDQYEKDRAKEKEEAEKARAERAKRVLEGYEQRRKAKKKSKGSWTIREVGDGNDISNYWLVRAQEDTDSGAVVLHTSANVKFPRKHPLFVNRYEATTYRDMLKASRGLSNKNAERKKKQKFDEDLDDSEFLKLLSDLE
jgi:hypothetical protein